MKKIILDEPILEDDFPVNMDYFYVVDGKVIRSDITGNVMDLKIDLRGFYKLEAKEVRRCDMFGRRKMEEQEEKEKPLKIMDDLLNKYKKQ